MDINLLQTALEQAITSRTSSPCRIQALSMLTGGAINETWRFSMQLQGEIRHYILRRTPGHETEGLAKNDEALLQQAAYEAGVAVARVVWILDASDGIGDAYVMDCIEGETIPRKILRDEQFASIRPEMASQCGAIAARIHSIDLSQLPKLPVQDLEQQLAYYQEIVAKSGLLLPVFEIAFKWLDKHRPREIENALVHGDFRNGNFIVDPQGIRAVLDWELAHLGDPMEDLAWPCISAWRFGNLEAPVGGFGQREQLFKSYEAVSGKTVDRQRVHYWEVLGTLKWGAMCMIITDAQSPEQRTIEQAAIGRRISETELDLLEILNQSEIAG